MHPNYRAPLAMAMMLAISAPQAVGANQQQKRFNLPAGPLAQQLNVLARQAGVLFSGDAALTADRRSQPVVNAQGVEQALAQMLAGTGLTALPSGKGEFQLAEQPDGDAVQLGVSYVDSSGLGETTEGTGAYATHAVTLGKGTQALKDIPQSVSVITQQRMQDQSLTTLDEALAQAPGVSVYQTSAHSTRYISRGSEITSFRVDGAPPTEAWTYGGSKELDMAMFDRIEILRGTDGLFSGAGEPGGSVNLVRKRPTVAPQVLVESSVASWNNYREMLDVGGPLGFDGALRGRSVLVSNTSDQFYDRARLNTKFFYGGLEADLGSSTQLLLGTTYNDYYKSDQVYGLVRSINGADLHLPRSTYLSGANDRTDGFTNSAFLHLDQQLGDHWAAALDTTYTVDKNSSGSYNFSGAVMDDGSGVSAQYGYQNPVATSKTFDLNLKGSERLLGFDNDFLLGWDWTDTDTHGNYYTGGDNREIPNIFTFNPREYLPADRLDWNGEDDSRTRQSGVYGSWRLHLTDALSTTLGGRYSNYSNRYAFYDGDTYDITPYNDRRVFTPFAGVSYNLNEQWTWYASGSETYKSQANYITPARAALDPVTGTTYETGIKGELLDGRVNTSLALYYTKRDGQASQLYRASGNCCYAAAGEMVSKGIDFEITGELLERLQATIAYNYNQVTNSDSITRNLDSNLLQPKHQAKLFAAYQLSGPLAKLKIGGGVTAQSPTAVKGAVYQRNNTGDYVLVSSDFAFSQAGYSVWNAFASYQVNSNFDVALNLNNLFDKRYYSTVGRSGYGNFYGEPKNYVVTLRAKF
ncbi:TonB-dependent siderophore receptor [Pseudomonas sp. S32]|uniref:TonB-dependent siderophore receptor n=1 Tax=Pseudomonas sp. S32 TaxID=2767448 RepID=UPI001911ED2D|nr:TonB-dependent receptor [Pseudomonas sp. S32]MBK5005543.1 TonB-dependent siderophore receptor [Pseudomonas sp. S32]